MNFDSVKDFKVLLIGDAIYDTYVFVTPLGKSIKESVISVRKEKEETYRGGVWAAAEHLKGLCAQVDVMRGPMVMTNTRYVEEIYNRKLFTTHSGKEEPNGQQYDIPAYDLVIVTDFGHGTMNQALIERVSSEAKFLAVNAQTNSTNFGFNLVTKYPRADFVVIDELEARLAAHDKDSPIEDVVRKLDYEKIIVTLGANGAVGYDGAFYQERAKTNRVVDTLGAGDAFLALTAPFAKAGFSMPALLSIGNAAGAAKAGIVGHRRSVTKEELEA